MVTNNNQYLDGSVKREELSNPNTTQPIAEEETNSLENDVFPPFRLF